MTYTSKMTTRPRTYEVDVLEPEGEAIVAHLTVADADLYAVKRALRAHYGPGRRAIVRRAGSAGIAVRYAALRSARRWVRDPRAYDTRGDQR